MSTELEKYFILLKSCLDSQHSAKAKECVISITDLVAGGEKQTAAEAEYSLDIIFNSQNSAIAFLQRSIKSSSRFQKANEEIFDLFRKLVQKQPKLVRKSAIAILKACIQFIQSSSVSARERELATTVVQDLLVYNCLDEGHDISQLLGDLLVVFDQRKLTNRFQQNLFELIGLLTKDYPECVSEQRQKNILDTMMSAAEGQLLEGSYPSLISLAGALQGLNHFLINFAPSDSGDDVCRRIYVLIKKLSDWDEAVKERAAFRNAIRLLERHSALFTRFLYVDYLYWQTVLTTKWIRSGIEDRKVGIYALQSFHREISRELLSSEEILNQSSSGSNDRTREARIVALNYFMKYFKAVLIAPDSKPYEVRIAIRGFGSMSEACSRLMSDEYMNELLLLVMQRTESVYLIEEKSKDLLEHLPDFVQALSDIMSHVRELTSVQLVSLQNIVIGLIKDFHYLSSSHHELVVGSLMKTFYNLAKLGGTVLESLLEKIVLRGMIWSCSHMLVVDANQEDRVSEGKSDWKDFITYKHYVPLWKGLLSQGPSLQLDRGPLIKIIYTQMMKTLFLILDKLDLNTRKRTVKDATGEMQELFFCDPNVDLVPVKPKDFHIFFNLVDLYQDLFRYNTEVRDHFEDWIPIYFDYMVKKSIMHPLVSGFVKLIDLGLITANSLQYFQHSFSKVTTTNLLVYFLELQIAKARNSTGELQLTCLRFVLNAPVSLLHSFLEEDSNDMIDILRISFKLGKGMLSLANIALSCVERVVAYDSPISEPNRERVIANTLPLLDSYLQTRDTVSSAITNSRLAKFQRKRSVNLTSSKIEKIKLQHALDNSETELVKFQRRVVLFLGELEPHMCTKIIHHESADCQQETERPLVLWDLDSNCNISLQLLATVGIRPIIKLDTIIARVCTLAVGSSDRKTKVAACELLHALILYVIGIQHHDRMTKLWTELCNHLLQLGTDTDIAVCQMFEPLIFQIIHYLTQPSKIGQKGTEVLANCLMDSISHPSDTSIRDLAARCIREFLLWTIKQTPVGQQTASTAMNLKVILEKLRTYSLDSNPNRRQGAALAFNNIYRVLREDETHIERSWFDLFYVFCVNFIMTEDFDSSTNSLEQVSVTIDHLVRVLIVRKDLFNKASSSRIIPTVFRGGLLKDLVMWVLKQCSSRETNYRHKCMEVFPRLTNAVEGCRSGAEFVRKYSTDGDVLNMCDHVDVIYGIRNASNLQFIVENNLPLIVNIYTWLEYLSSSMDMYYWLLRNSLLHNPEDFLRQSNLFAVVEFFLTSVVNATMFDLMSMLRPEIVEESAGSIEFRVCTEKIIKYNMLKCTITVRIIDLLVTVLPQRCCRSIPESFWESRAVLNFIVDLVYEPQKMGFDFKSCQETIAKLPEKVEQLLAKIEGFEHGSFKERVHQVVGEKLGRTIMNVSERLEDLMKAETIGLEDSNLVKGVMMIAKRYETYRHSFGERTNSFLEVVSDKLIHDVFDGLKEKRVEELFQATLTPSVKRFAETVLRCALMFKSAAAMELLIKLMLNDDKLRLFQQSDKSGILHGEHFASTFREPIYDYIAQQIPESVEKLIGSLNVTNFSMIVHTLCSFLEFNYQKNRSQIHVLKAVTEQILNSWKIIFEVASQVENKFGSSDLHLIELMSNVAMASPTPISQIGRKALGFQPWLLGLIENPQNQLDLKSKAMFLLPTLVGDTDFDSAEVSAALQKLQDQHFPLHSSEFSASSVQRISFESCILALLDAMVVSRSPVILKAVINATAADPEHIAEQKIRTALGEYIRIQTSSQQCYNLKEIFLKFCDESLEPSIRLTVLKRFLITGIRLGSVETILAFYKLVIKKIYEMIRSNYGQFGAGWDAEQALVNRFGGFQLIELYVAILPQSMVITDDCMVAKALYGESGKAPGNKMITDFTKKAYACRAEVFLTPDSPTAELFRKYQCAAYRALAAIISNTKEDLQLYNVLLFRESHDKNEFIWRKLINCSEDQIYDCSSQELEDYPKIKDKIVSIRRLTSASGKSANRFKYIQMTSVFESSLSQDVTKLDLNYSVVRTTQEVSVREVDELSQQVHRRFTVPLEQSKLNDHEVMATVCAVIQHMHENKITPTVEGVRAVPPPWVKFLVASVSDRDQHKNVRLFLTKVIDNCRQWLKPYASTLVPALMQVIVDECISAQLNTFVTDLIALILEWSDVFKPSSLDEICLASGLVKFLMRHCYHARREVFRLNLELAKNLIEQWKTVINVPVQLLYDMIGPSQDPESKQNLCGLQLNAIVLANGLVPWTETSKFDFIRAIFRCLDSEKTAVYRPASELLGMCLSHLYPEGEQSEDERYQNEFLAKLMALRKIHENKFMDVVYGIHKSFSPVVDSFLVVISHAIPNATGASKKIYLEMLLSRVEAYKEQVHRELISLDLKGLLRDRTYQLLALHLINKSLSLMTPQNLDDLLVNVFSLASSDRSDVRDVVYEILIFIHENSIQRLQESTQQMLRKALLVGLNDSDQSLQSRIFEFWMDGSRFPEEIDARFQRILSSLYDPAQEANYLGYATQILLDSAVKNPESKRRIFQHEYEADVKLREYSIDTRWRLRNSFASAPLFVESQQRYLTTTDGSQMEQMIKATQFGTSGNAFEPTLDPTAMSQTASTFTLPTQNSLLFEVNPPILDRRSRLTAAGTGFVTGKSSKSYDSLRKRILKDKERSAHDQALRAIERHSYEAVRKAESHKMKQSEVVLYRRYRIGDFPDLLINSLALLLPLQAICRRDSALARQVFVSIFDGILDEWEQSEQHSNDRILAISQSIQKILTETKSCDPNLFGALVELAMKRPRVFDLAADSVAAVACGANMMSMGVLYLEHKLHEYDFPDGSIVSHSSSVTLEAIHWIKLAELYHMLNEYDVLGDIFSDKMDSDTRLKKAIELESSGNFYRARELYHIMIRENQGRLAEQNFCYQSYFNCYAQMGMWEDLEIILEKQTDGNDAEDFWTDEWNMENILPNYFHCNTRLNLAGDERGRAFIVLLDRWMLIPDRMDYIKANFGEEITMLQLASGEYSRAKMYSDQVLRHFLQEWSYLDIMSAKLRVRKLLDIRKVSEIHAFSDLLGNPLEPKQLHKLVANWQNSSPSVSDSLLVWDALLTYRKFVQSLLETRLEDAADDRLLQTDFVGLLKGAIFDAELHLLDAAFGQNNLRFARKIINRLAALADEQNESGYCYRIAQLKMRRFFEMESGGGPAITLQRIGKNFERLRVVVENDELGRHPNVKVEGLQELYCMSQTLREIVRNNPEADVEALRRFLPFAGEESLEIQFNRYSRECLQKSIEIANNCILESSTVQAKDTIRLADCHLKLAQFCYEGLEREAIGETINLEEQLITSLLASMQYGSKPARQLFPCLLQLPHLQDGSLHRVFTEASSPVPEWMFLRWIPQILSYVDFANESFLADLLLRIARSYPMALYYSTKLTYENFLKNGGSQSTGTFASKILKTLELPKLDRFTRELCHVLIPSMKVKKMVSDMSMKLLQSSEITNNAQFRQQVTDSMVGVFPDATSDLGHEHRKIIPLKEEWLKLLEYDFESQINDIWKRLDHVRKEADKLDPRHNTLDLCRYSPWLAAYHFSDREDMLELPGQYNVDYRPNVLNHVKIVKVCNTLEMYTTLRKPLRLQIMGSDGRTYDFLVKFGEDLRQDQRIQQLLGTISTQLSLDKHCKDHQLSVRTYEVIPIKNDFGLIGWMPNTSSIKSVAVRSMVRFNPNGDVTNVINREYDQFLTQTAGLSSDRRPMLSKVYGKVAAVSTPEKIMLKFNELRYKIKEDALKRALFEMTASPESFYNLRGNFAKSLMAMNISCWILGIGDRHTSNLLIDRSSGRLAGVDFGIAFGAGTRDQGIPEMVPFRLTPQFVSVMEPMRTSGLMHKCLVYTLACLRNSKKLLKSCLEVFVREPTLDWLEASRRRFNQEDTKSILTWDPQTRINIAIRKLNGANPKVLVAEEMRLGQVNHTQEFLEGYLKLLQVDTPALPEGNLTVEQQVQCLLHAATSGSILGIAFAGWFPWF
ncbi:DNA-dependent protein kinase catalytic subunit-like isoform X2 [Topomyia yanbarensis]|uniref:DNA-dependent protein kinase catalytic subunit-like isoform X2 n=1 Tax=Topomyia yanbarensis TaxID=2498891 RepID=UPI00273AB519|nr:DNA-dependent protein kinase catalytic subunit-like isoform X2 [Topomyia yanbarensis]